MIDCWKERLVGRDLYSKQISIFYLSFRSMGVFSTLQTLESPGRWSSRHVCGGHLSYVSWCRGIHSLAGIVDDLKYRRKTLACIHRCCVLLVMDAVWPIPSGSCHYDYNVSTVMDCHPNCKSNWTRSLSSCFCQWVLQQQRGEGGRQTTLKGYKYWSGKTIQMFSRHWRWREAGTDCHGGNRMRKRSTL